MRASIISVGSELLRGTLLDTNAQFFAGELHALGAEVIQATQVPDVLQPITRAMEQAAAASDFVLVTGGLGPTDDDLTREAVIALTGESPTVDNRIVDQIRERFTHRGDRMPSRNEKQAWTIPSADVLPNPHGTAPGWFVQLPGSAIAIVPGPPRENRPMWRDSIRSRVVSTIARQVILSRTIKTIGIGESAVAERLAQLIAADWPVVATYAKSDGVHVTITSAHNDRFSAEQSLRDTSAEVVDILGDHVYSVDDESLAAALMQPLIAAGTRIAVWEAGTAGGLSSLLLSESATQDLVGDSRIWPVPGRDHPGIRDFARLAARTSGYGTACALTASFSESDSEVINGAASVAFAHAGRIVDREYSVRGTPGEIRRRSVLIAAEFLWSEVRLAAGVRQAHGRSSRSART